MATNDTPNGKLTDNVPDGIVRPGWSVGTQATIALAAVTVVLLVLHLVASAPAWLVWVAGGLTLAAFVVALIRRARRSAELEHDLY